MTNAMIIEQAAIELMKAGKIGTTGRMFKAITVDENGNEREEFINEPEPIHTFQYWKSAGYKVKKGEHAVARIPIWKYSEKKDVDENGNEIDLSRMFQKVSCFFAMAQVEKIAE